MLLVFSVWPTWPAVAAGTFGLTPSKIEVALNPGSSVIRNIYLTNDLGRDAHFKIEVEDVSGGATVDEAVKFYGPSAGPYSLKNYLLINSTDIVLTAGETRAVPIMISAPRGVAPGGLYGAVFFSAVSASAASAPGPKLSTRLGALVFLRVKGAVLEKAKVKKFGLIGENNLWSSRPARFQAVVENDGNVYLNPYGYIEIREAWHGSLVAKLPIEPWYVFPASTRAREVLWPNRPLFGWYRATLFLNKGYNNQIENSEVSFVAFPVRLASWSLVAVLLGLVLVWRFIVKNRKKKNLSR